MENLAEVIEEEAQRLLESEFIKLGDKKPAKIKMNLWSGKRFNANVDVWEDKLGRFIVPAKFDMKGLLSMSVEDKEIEIERFEERIINGILLSYVVYPKRS